MALRTRLACFALLLMPVGCGSPSTPDDGGAGSSTTSPMTEGSSQTAGSESQSSGMDGTSSEGSGSPTIEPATCEDGTVGYRATAEVLDEGLGPTGAPVTIENCTDQVAYVQQDCCYGAAFMLERKDAPDDPWRTSMPAAECDCEGLIEPLAIEPGGQIVVETQPSSYDSEPLCVEPYSAIYRWTFVMGNEAECADCWEEVPTNDIGWYCEG